jgi:hypothetical protein
VASSDLALTVKKLALEIHALAQGIHYMRSVEIMIIEYKSTVSGGSNILGGRQAAYGGCDVEEV